MPQAGLRAFLMIGWPLFCAAADDDFLVKVLERARTQMARIPDFVCAQTVERSERGPAQQEFRVRDRLHLEVTSIGGKERFAKAGGSRFEDRELHEMLRRGMVSTGGYSLFLRHATQPGSAEYRLGEGSEAEIDGRRVRRYEFNVPWERSGYTISTPQHQARVGFHGSFLADLETHEILRLEATADEIPGELGFDRTHLVMNYRVVLVGETPFSFATDVETLATTLDGNEYRNRTGLGACRRYSAESAITFAAQDEPPASPSQPTRPDAKPARWRQNLLLEVTLDHEIALATLAPDSTFRATLAEPLRDGETVLVPAGAAVVGRVLELERLARPVDRFEVVLRLDSLGGEPLSARLRDTGGGAGLIRQERRLMPVFDKKKANRFSVLVRETGPERAVLYWDAKHPRIAKGFRMRWLTESME